MALSRDQFRDEETELLNGIIYILVKSGTYNVIRGIDNELGRCAES